MIKTFVQYEEMKTEYKYIFFTIIGHKPKTKVWGCYNKVFDNKKIGVVKWYAQWRKYLFFGIGDFSMDAQCASEISEFLKNAMEEHKIKSKKKRGGCYPEGQ